MCCHLGGTNLWLQERRSSGVNDAPDEVKARASCERGRTGAALTGIPCMVRAQGRLNLETWWRRWCCVELCAWDRCANITTTGAADTESGIHDGGSGASPRFPCEGKEGCRYSESLDWTHPRKNYVSGSWVDASAKAALCGEARVDAS